jgi:predicted dehydrogenase
MSQPGRNIDMAVVGLGDWGHNHVRTLAGLPDCNVRYIFDQNDEKVRKQLAQKPSLRAAESLDTILDDPEVDAVVIATTAPSHFELARRVVESGKDVLIEKPMTLEVRHAELLCNLATEKGQLIQVGHLLLFHPAVQCLKQLIDNGDLGDVHYIYSQRLNLGVVRQDENALWSLAPHDFSLINYLFESVPHSLNASGGTYLQKDIGDVFFVTLHYPGGQIGHSHVSWLDPQKVRRLTVVGSRKMVVFDDMSTTEKIRIYDKGIEAPDYENYGEVLQIRTGDIHSPAVDNTEPLKLQAQHFLECVRERKNPIVDGKAGLAVVRMLDMAGQALEKVRTDVV